jgi:exonuclease SbcC
MRIRTATLTNIRSHRKSQLQFERGFNCLVGGLGTGKSSVLYAIDFALFGDPLGRSYNYLLREGEDAGMVALEFLLNGKTYRIHRGLKRRGKGIGQDTEQLKLEEGNELVASMKNEAVAEQLKALTGLDKEIFREVIWVRQEHLKEMLDMTPRERQRRLDHLFSLSDYEVAWSNIREFQRGYVAEKTVLERDFDVMGIDKLEEDYHEAVEKFSILDTQTLTIKRRVQEEEQRLRDLASQLQGLEHLRSETESLLKKEAELETKIANSQDRSSRLAHDLRTKTADIRRNQGRVKDLEATLTTQRNRLHETGLASDSTIEDLKRQLSSFERQMTSIKAEQEAGIKENQTSRKQAKDLEGESKCPLCLQPLPEDYKVHILRHIQEESKERETRLTELQKNIQELENLRGVIGKAILEIQATTPRIQDTREHILKEEESKRGMEKEFEEQQMEESNLGKQLDQVRTEIAKFDLAKLREARKRYEATLAQRNSAQSDLDTNDRDKRETASRIEDLRTRLERAQQKVERITKIEQLVDTINAVRDAYRSIQPRLRSEFVKILQQMMQHMLDNLVGEEGEALFTYIDETYTPFVKSRKGPEREVSSLSGGERTLLAFAYRLALGQLIMQARTGHSLQLLLLDEPTESLGEEDGSVNRLAKAIARLKAVEQIIAVTHNETLANQADHVIRLAKEAGASAVKIAP